MQFLLCLVAYIAVKDRETRLDGNALITVIPLCKYIENLLMKLNSFLRHRCNSD